MRYALFVVAAVLAAGALAAVGTATKPRKPVSPSDAAWVVLFAAGEIVVVLMAAYRL